MLLVLIRYDLDTLTGARPQFEQIGLTADDVCDLSSYFRRTGFWRTDIEQGLTYWTRGVFDIFGMEYREGPVSLTEANAAIHPNDLGAMLEMVEQATIIRAPFHAIIRLRSRESEYRFIRTVGKYRETADGKPEFVGMIYEFFEPIRTLGMAAPIDE